MDPATWPDSVLRLAKAITVAEGSNPEWNNPGDLTYAMGFPTLGTVNSDGVLKFANADDGQHVLCHQCYLMLTGKSAVYKLTDTLEVVGAKYSNGDPNWAKNVAAYLGVSEQATLEQLAI